VAVERLEIARRGPFAAGTAFGPAGAYERLDGTVRFAVDPLHPANAGIVDLALARRDPDGRVRFRADFCLLQPEDPRRGSGRLLVDVPNRGNKVAVRLLNRARPDATPTAGIDPGDGFLMRHGWSVAWCGWQWDVPHDPALLGLEAPPVPLDGGPGGRPLEGNAVVEIQPDAPGRDHLLANRAHRPYPAADTADGAAVMTVRDWPGGPRTVIPRARWRFARQEGDAVLPDATRLWLEDGFDAGRVYEVVYRPALAVVVGAGLLAVRDFAAALRNGAPADGNPCAGRVRRAYAFGVSQTGRFLRHFLYLGLNRDESGRAVFDGLLPHVAGARRGEFNHRFAQPSAQAVPGFGHLFPFAFDDQTDPLSGPAGPADGLLRRQRAAGAVPRIVATNTAAEYWRGDASLLHTDVLGETDAEPPPEVRVYLFAGTQHGPGTLPPAPGDAAVGPGGGGTHVANAVDYAPLLRAALTNLDRWVSDGVAPPASVFPRLADGTAVPGREVLRRLREAAIPGMTLPDPALLPALRRYDLGPDAARGVGRYPAVAGEAYPTYVSAVDGDGNEVGGIRLPDLTVPLATSTGWNPRHPDSGGPGQLVNMQGSTVPLPPTAGARRASGDPRPSIAERYPDRATYLQRVRRAADALVGDGYLLVEDVATVVAAAGARYDRFAVPEAPSGVTAGATADAGVP
jgi:hypothetical protein